MQKPKIIILLSVYNGTDYLRLLLESVLSQKQVDVEVLIRNDGSTNPDTISIINQYSEKPNVKYVNGQNLGPAQSFFELMKIAGDADYYAFADQDDIWFDNKLITAVSEIEKIKPEENNVLFFSNYDIIDSKGTIIQKAAKRNLNINQYNCLIESFAPGCSMVFNHHLLQLVRDHLPSEGHIHDRWTFLTAMFMGRVLVDDRPLIQYRLHENNAVGCLTEKEKHFSIKRLLQPTSFSADDYAAEMLKVYDESLDNNEKILLRKVATYKKNIFNRIWMAFSPKCSLAHGGVRRRAYWALRILLKKV